MAFIQLENISKIYSSGGTIAIGIQKVNLEFQLGEFVAITGKSGSGKTTLLNVISGLDSYEEGEMYIEGEETSHYTSSDWEKYRQKYVSFIFQDYNIIESFTVLENVEFALMHIADIKERRARALELIDKVGLTSHIKQKGSRLSGGQKQRTVIARALAKDSPIIFADEPTGNLDAQSSKDIIKLLADISKEKLVLLVTHNFEQVQEYASREIRTFDGQIALDDKIKSTKPIHIDTITPNKIKNTTKEGARLGLHKFFAQPKLTTFLCASFTIAVFALFAITALIGNVFQTMQVHPFRHIDGRVVVFKQDGSSFMNSDTDADTSAEIDKLTTDYDCQYLTYDYAYDTTQYLRLVTSNSNKWGYTSYVRTNNAYQFQPYSTKLKADYGIAPQAKDEVFLYAPIHDKPNLINDNGQLKEHVYIYDYAYKLVGVKFFYDNTKPSVAMFSDNGFRDLSIRAFISSQNNQNNYYDYYGYISYADSDNSATNAVNMGISPTFSYVEPQPIQNNTIMISEELQGKEILYYNGIEVEEKYGLIELLGKEYLLYNKSIDNNEYSKYLKADNGAYFAGYYISFEQAESLYKDNANRISLIFKNDKVAQNNIKSLIDDGYTVFTTDIKIANYDGMAMIIFSNIMYMFLWVLVIIFIWLFISLISVRINERNKGDIAIFRTMGIKTKVVKQSVFWHNLIAMIPPIIINAIVATIAYIIPSTNEVLTFLHFGGYFFILVGIIAIALLVSWRFNKRLFKETVRKNLRGGRKNDKTK